MANTKISELPTATANVADAFVGNQSGTSKALSIGTSVDAASGDKLLGASADGNIKQLTPKIAMIDDVFSTPTSWTPTLYGTTTTGTTTYDEQSGYYIKTGRLVYCVFRVGWSNLTGTGGARIGGLPFAATDFSPNQRHGINFSYYNSLSLPSGTILGGFITDKADYIRLLNVSNITQNDATDLQTEITTAGEIYGSFHYIVD